MLLRSQGLLKTHNLVFSNYMLLCHRNSIGRLKFNSHWKMLCTLETLRPGCFLTLTYSPPDLHRHSPTFPSSLCSNVIVSVTFYLRLQSIPSQLYFLFHGTFYYITFIFNIFNVFLPSAGM